MGSVRIFLMKLTAGLPDCCVKIVDEPVLNINSKKGINMPIDTIEKTIDKIVKRK